MRRRAWHRATPSRVRPAWLSVHAAESGATRNGHDRHHVDHPRGPSRIGSGGPSSPALICTSP
jgi:hypothetical protein